MESVHRLMKSMKSNDHKQLLKGSQLTAIRLIENKVRVSVIEFLIGNIACNTFFYFHSI